MSKFTRKPKAQAAPDVNDFIEGAWRPQAPPPPAKRYPWEDPSVRDDVQKIYNLRLPEAYFLKLKHIADNTPGSMQRFCLEVLLPAIDAKIEELTR